MGQARLLAVTRVLLRGTTLAIFDEPEANLDAASRARLLEVLKEGNKAKVIS